MNTESVSPKTQDLGNLVLGNLTWMKCQEDPELRETPEGMKQVRCEFISLSPTILGDLLFEVVSLTSIMQSKLAFLQYCQENGFVQKMIAAMPEEALGWMSRGDVLKNIVSTLDCLIELAKSISGNIIGFLEKNGITEEQVLTAPESKLCLDESLRGRYRAGTLTIRELLLEQPMIILKNS
ncbi:MAG: hypothetical protein IPJ67_03725 [Candidatus Moraniibacteriota bacterium]|nr:MAG: hypothetical protein IPJ67_03725 [Candidatus Moranbacteria bacterium]